MKKTYIQPLCETVSAAATSNIMAGSVKPTKINPGDGSEEEFEESGDDGWAASKNHNIWDED